MKNTVLALLAAGVLIGCGGHSKTPAQKIAELEASGAIPTLERSDTIEGIDANNNGVRDDIEAYIANEYSIEEQRKAAMQLARAFQSALLVDLEDIASLRRVDRELSYGINCVFSTFYADDKAQDPAQVLYELEAITANTKARLKVYLSYNKALDGTVSSLPKGDTCD